MKKLEFKTSKGDFIIEEASEKNLGRVLIKHMTEEQFADVVDSFELFGNINVGYKNYAEEEPVLDTAKESFESLINSRGYYLFENPYTDPGLMPSAELDLYRKTNDKVFFNPILLKRV